MTALGPYIFLFSDFVVSRLPPSREIYFLPTSCHYKPIMSSQNRIKFIEKGQSKCSSKTQESPCYDLVS